MPDRTIPATFHISGTDLKPSAFTRSSNAFTLPGEPVMLAPDVALNEEVEGSRSAGLIPKPGRGGSRALPWAVTRKGAMRLATIMKTPRAIEASDIFIDVFDEVLRQVIEQPQDMYERRQADLAEKVLDRERRSLENLRLRIDAAKSVVALYRDLEPSALVDLTRGFASPLPATPRALPPATPKKDDA